MTGDDDRRLAEISDDPIADRLETALWIYGFDDGRVIWANRAALALWDAPDLAALTTRDLRAEMSASVRKRLAQHREDFELYPDREIRELWTLYPQGQPTRVRATLRRCALRSGAAAMLVEARAQEKSAPETVRSADALLHTQVITALFEQGGSELYANPAFRATFGPGRHRFGLDFAVCAEAEAFHRGLAAAGEHRATVRVETVNGARWHDIHATRCRDAVTGDGAFLISAIDVTEAREHQRQLAEARDAAQAADRAKTVFLATMSHEMRTPLNGVLGMASVLAQSRLDAAQRTQLELIAKSGEQMLELIEDMLDIVALDARSVEIRKGPFEPGKLLHAVAAMTAADAEAKALRVEVDARGCGARSYLHDASRIRQVLRHLLSNAVKFTDQGMVVLRARDDGAGGLRFEVADSGPGVPDEARARIFERFQQLDGAPTRRHGGAGLGLAICRDLVRLWGGEIGVQGREGEGATFWFSVPDARPDGAAPAAAAE